MFIRIEQQNYQNQKKLRCLFRSNHYPPSGGTDLVKM